MFRVGRQKLAPQRGQQLAVEPAGILEADFQLRGMDVHVDHFGRHLHRQKGDRLAADHQQPAIGLAQGVLQRPVADVPAVEKEILHPVVAAALAGMGRIAGERHLVLDALDPNQVVGQLAAEEQRDPLQPAVAGGQLEDRLVVVPQREMDVRRGQGDAGERLGDVAELGGRGPQKLPPHGRVEEQVVHLDARADRAAARGRLRPRRRRRPRSPPPLWLSGVRLRNTNRLTSAIEASASPRKPSVPTRNRSSASASLLVAWLARASGSSSVGMPPPLSTTRTISNPPWTTATSIRVAPASTAFSINSLTTLAGRSITSPAAILLIRD